MANGNKWVHNPAHRGGVPYNNRNVANRFNAAQGNLKARPTVAQTQQRLNQSNPANALVTGFGPAKALSDQPVATPSGQAKVVPDNAPRQRRETSAARRW